ncbi:MAG: Crp/Fnr family transcriptional regulator [Blastocatellia bacterium]
MIRETPETDEFKQKLCDSLMKEMSAYPTVKIIKNASIYAPGDKDALVYFIESGQIKLLMLSPQGKECILAIHSLGDVFGELCIGYPSERTETAIAMTDTQLKAIPSTQFLQHLSSESLLEGFVQYLALRIAEQQHIIASLVTVDSEERLGNILLQLARSRGKQHPRSILIALTISYQELAAMIGTNLYWVSLFMQRFHNLGLIETEQDYIIVKEQKLSNYLGNFN